MKTYYYYNIKAIDKLLKEKEISKVSDILLKEMYHFIDFSEAKYYYDFLDKILKETLTSIDIFKKIFEKIKNQTEIIVLDQYETKYDIKYYILRNILNSTYSCRLIIISSMNEDDIRESILCSLKYSLKISKDKPKLDYYYKINDAITKSRYDLSITFKNEIMKEIDRNIKEFYYLSDKNDLLQIFINLIMKDEQEYQFQDILRLIGKIPFRYFLIKHENKNIIHFSELKETDII